jgi:hypothetical protein
MEQGAIQMGTDTVNHPQLKGNELFLHVTSFQS